VWNAYGIRLRALHISEAFVDKWLQMSMSRQQTVADVDVAQPKQQRRRIDDGGAHGAGEAHDMVSASARDDVTGVEAMSGVADGDGGESSIISAIRRRPSGPSHAAASMCTAFAASPAALAPVCLDEEEAVLINGVFVKARPPEQARPAKQVKSMNEEAPAPMTPTTTDSAGVHALDVQAAGAVIQPEAVLSVATPTVDVAMVREVVAVNVEASAAASPGTLNAELGIDDVAMTRLKHALLDVMVGLCGCIVQHLSK
jgi:hypothetical protein